MSYFISIVGVGVLIALHELGHFAAARRMGMRVLRFSVGFFNAIWSHTSKKSGTVYQIGMLPLGGFVQIKGMNPFEDNAKTDPDSYQNKPVWRRAAVLLAGPGANLAIAFVILLILYGFSGIPRDLDKPWIGTVVQHSRAAEAGLQEGDKVAFLNGKALSTWEELTFGLRANPDKKVRLDILRNGKAMTLHVTPENRDGVGKIGIGPPREFISVPIHLATLGAAMKCIEVTIGSLIAVAKLVSFQKSDVQAVGPPGIIKMAASTLDSGAWDFFALMAYLSLMLFLFNMLPFPALDGGRGVFLLVEAVSRRKVNPKVDVIVNSTGFILLVGLLLFMTVRDIVT